MLLFSKYITEFFRKVLKGGSLIATDGNCLLGPPLAAHIDTFLGISGANYGLCVCQLAQTIPAWCNALDGLYPGYTCEDQVFQSFQRIFENSLLTAYFSADLVIESNISDIMLRS